jgi:hypothetical protein
MKIINDLNKATKALYDHVGFVEDWVLCPIDDCTNAYWSVDDDAVKFAETKEKFYSDGDYYLDDIYKQRHYKKYVYVGEKLTMIMCDPHVDMVQWFRVFSNDKRVY